MDWPSFRRHSVHFFVYTPIFGQTGGGTVRTQGTITNSTGTTSYTGSTYIMPTYGFVGSSRGTRTTYNRTIAVNIVEAKSYRLGVPKTVYEGRVKSSGSCSMIAEVFDEMLVVIFDRFPGENGRNKKLRVRAETNCSIIVWWLLG